LPKQAPSSACPLADRLLGWKLRASQSGAAITVIGHKNYNLSIILPIAWVDGGFCAIFEKCHFRRGGVTRAVESARWLAAC